MSKYQTTMYNRYQRVNRKVSGILSMVQQLSLDHDRLLKEMKKVYDSSDYKKLNQYYKGFIAGKYEAIRDSWHYDRSNPNKVKWFHTVGEDFYEKWSDIPEDIRYDNKKFRSGHYWSETKRPFFGSNWETVATFEDIEVKGEKENE